jgi:hypothetical protein
MKLKSNLPFNASLINSKGNRVLIPSGATLELDDKDYALIEDQIKSGVEAGKIKIVVAPVKSEEVKAKEKAEAIAAAKALLEEAEPEKAPAKPAAKKAPAKKEA